MWTKQKRISNKGRLVVPVMAIAFLSYFGYHIYHGDYGLSSRQKVENHIQALVDELHQVEEQRKEIETRIALLKDGSIERDMLDEYARRQLNLSRENELIILLDH